MGVFIWQAESCESLKNFDFTEHQRGRFSVSVYFVLVDELLKFAEADVRDQETNGSFVRVLPVRGRRSECRERGYLA